MDHSHHHHPESMTKEYAKLAGVIFVIAVASVFVHNYHLTSHNLMAVFMGIFFLVFAAFKLVNLKSFVEAYSGYDIIAQRSTAYAYAYPFIEVVLGLGSLFNLPGIHYFIVLFMVMGSIGIFQQLMRKSNFQCACLGNFIKLPLTTVSLTEDLVMLFMALYLIIK